MLLKIIGGLIVIGTSSFLGMVYSKECTKRPQELRVLQGMLQMLENEMSYLSNTLSDAFEKIARSCESSVTIFFESTIEKLETSESINASLAWEQAVRENLKTTALTKEDGEVLASFGKILGASDIEGQIKNIRLTVNQLKMQEQKAEESKKKNEAMYRNLGILGGIAVVIILI